MKRAKAILLSFMTVLCVILASLGFAACGASDDARTETKLAFNGNLKESYVVGEYIDLEEAIDLPEFKSYSMKAEYELDGKTKSYLCVGLSFKPTYVGEVKVTVICGSETIGKTLRIVEIAPSLGPVDNPEYEIGDTVTVDELEACVNVLPLGTPVVVSKVRYAGGEQTELAGDTFTFENIGEYEFYYTAENSSGKIDGTFSATVTREQTAVELVDLTNGIRQMDYSTVEQVDDHSEDSDWSWKVSADPTGMYANGSNHSYWLSRVYFDFGRVIDLSKEYIEMDVWASENTYEGGVLIYYAPSYPMQLEWHVCPSTTYNQWTTVSTGSTSISGDAEKTKTGVRGIIVTVLHRQVGEYNPQEVYMLFDNLRVLEYPVLGKNEVDDATNNGSNGSSQGVSFRRYVDKNTGAAIDKAAESDWAYKLSTKSESKASDYPYADVFFTTTYENFSLEEYSFSFFVKGNDAYYHEQFYYSVLYFNDQGALTYLGSWQYKCALEAGAWNYVSAENNGIVGGKVAGIRFWLNTSTTSVCDAELYVDNLRIYARSEAEENDLSNRISVNARNDVSYSMTTAETNGESAWAWRLSGEHFDYFKVTFDGQYAFSNYVLSMDIKAKENFGGVVVLQFVAADGSVKKDLIVRKGDAGWTEGDDGWITVDTSADGSLLALYTGVNVYLMAEDKTKSVELVLDNVNLASRGLKEYVAVNADDWETTKNGDGSTTYDLVSYTGSETYIQLLKEGGYTNEFISVKTKLDGTQNAGLVLGARIPTATATSNSQAYNKEGFYLVFNDGFFTLYGPTYHGNHLGSFNYIPAPKADTEYELRFGVLWNNGSFKAILYIYELDGTLHSSYEWTDLERGGNPSLEREPKAGSFIVYSWYDTERSFTVSSPYDYIDAPKIGAEGTTITFGAGYADKYLVSVDGGKTWNENTTGRYEMTAYGVYDMQVKAYLGDVESELVAKQIVYVEDDITIGNMTDVSFTDLTHEKGNITFTSADGITSRNVAGINLNGDYTNEFIKVTFTSVGSSLSSNGIALGLRGLNTASALCDPLYTGGWLLNPEKNNGGYFSTCFVDESGKFRHAVDYLSGALGAVFETLASSVSLTDGLIEGEEYSYLYGAIGSGENTAVYFGLYHGETLLNLYKWEWSALHEKYLSGNYGYASFPTIRDSGSFHIWYSGSGSRTISYETLGDVSGELSKYEAPALKVSGNTVTWNKIGWADGYLVSIDGGVNETATTETSYTLSAYGAYNISVKAYKGATESAAATLGFVYGSTPTATTNIGTLTAYSEKDGEKSFTFAPAANVTTTGYQSQSVVAIADDTKYSDAFLKVGFTAVSTYLSDNYLNLSLRVSSATSTNPVFNNTVNFFAYNNGHDNISPSRNNVQTWTDLGSGLLMVGKQYYMIAGVTTGADGNADLYYIVTEVQEDGSEKCIVKLTWDYEDLSCAANPLNESGYFVLSSWYGEERTLTYRVLTGETEMNEYINMTVSSGN